MVVRMLRGIFTGIVAAGMLLGQAPALATPKFSINGFGTLGVNLADHDTLGYRTNISKEGTFDDDVNFKGASVLGLQLNAKFNDNLSFTLQATARERAEDKFSNLADWAYFSFTPTEQWKIRAGRLGLDVFLLSDYLNVAFAYLWTNPPVAFYGQIPFYHFDGSDISYTTAFAGGELNTRLFAGQSDFAFADNGDNYILDVSPVFGGTIAWQAEEWRIKLGASGVRFKDEFAFLAPYREAFTDAAQLGWTEAAATARQLEMKDSWIKYLSLGAAYDSANWMVQAETSLTDAESDVLTSSYSGYLSVGRKFDSLTLYSVASFARNNQDMVKAPEAPTPALQPIQLASQAFFNRLTTEQNSLAIGGRWNLKHNIALKAQFERTWVDPFGSILLDARITPESKEVIDSLTLQVDFIF